MVRILIEDIKLMLIPNRFDPINIRSWGLSKSVIGLLSRDPDLVSRLDRVRQCRLFSPKYQPNTIEVFYDDTCWIKSVDGRIIYHKILIKKFIPTVIEVRFDGEIAMFSIDSEMIVDRTVNSAPLLALLGTDVSSVI